jgi:hypothetical protein
MTPDDLLNLVATSFLHQPQAAAGGFLFCHTPHVGAFAYLGRVYGPISSECASAWAAKARGLTSPYLSFVTKVANGLRIANISLYGVIEQVDRTVGQGVGQPISLDYGNVVERPANLNDTDLVIGGIVGWSSRGCYIMDREGAIRLTHHTDGADVIDSWDSIDTMLRSELNRIAAWHDQDGRAIGTHTDLMHPNGRHWETETEPGTTRM